MFLLSACEQTRSAAMAPPPATPSSPAGWGAYPLPDPQFVGFAQTVNDFEVQSGQLALSKSSNALVRSYASRAVPEYTANAQLLSRNRADAGVSYAPDENVKSIADNAMSRLNSLQGSDFDKAYADAQVRLQTAAVAQFGAYGGNAGANGSLRRYAQQMLPKSQSNLEFAQRLGGGV
jgi:putative membrane protein